MKTLDQVEPRTPLDTTAPIVISSPGSYYLTGDVSSTGNGIDIQADDVTVDLNGFTLVGDGSGEGLDISSQTNIVVRNGRIRGFLRGALVSGATGVRLTDLRIVDSTLSGVFVTSQSEDIEIHGCAVSKNGANGIHVYSGNDMVSTLRPHYIRNNTVHDNGNIGILASRVQSFVEGNVVTSHTSHGIMLDGGDHSVIGNRVHHNLGDGIHIAADFVYVVDNMVVSNQGTGIEDASGAGALVTRNLAQFNDSGNYGLTLGSHGLTGDVDTDPNGWRSVHR